MERREKGSGSLIKRKGCRYWYASYYDAAGKQQRASTKTDVKQEALGVLRRLMGDSERGLAPVNNKLAYGDIRAGLLSNYVERGNKSLHVLADGTEAIVGLRQLDAFCGFTATSPGIAVGKITTDFTREFARKRTAEGAGPAMVNRSLQCLRRMLNIAREDGKIQNVPKIRLLKEPAARKGFLPRADFEKLLAALSAALRPLITFLYYCGVRLGEAQQIEWAQVDLDGGLIRLEEEQTKSGEQRIVPIPDVLLAMLKPVQPKAGRVFDSTNLRTDWARACAAVGLGTIEKKKSKAGWKYETYSGLIVHDLRRSAIMNLTQAGVSENVAMKISGHKTREVFRRYNIVVTNDVLAAMRAVESTANPAPALLGKPFTLETGNEMLRRLSEHFSVRAPGFAFTHGDRATYYPKTRTIKFPKYSDSDENPCRALVHEFAHYLEHVRGYECVGHGVGFSQTLSEVAGAWYGDPGRYPWHEEYPEVKAWWVKSHAGLSVAPVSAKLVQTAPSRERKLLKT